MNGMSLRLLKGDWTPADVVLHRPLDEEDEALGGIRCPVCGWRPTASSLWCCAGLGTPEPYFAGCGMLWNTFSTHGECPGCHHRWQWTSCLRCEQWSLHEDWYEKPADR
jgi:hypothetical protein